MSLPINESRRADCSHTGHYGKYSCHNFFSYRNLIIYLGLENTECSMNKNNPINLAKLQWVGGTFVINANGSTIGFDSIDLSLATMATLTPYCPFSTSTGPFIWMFLCFLLLLDRGISTLAYVFKGTSL